MKKKHLFILLLCICTSCTLFEKKITTEQIKIIKENFTKEEIVYFYETVFFRDSDTRDFKPFVRSTRVQKWEKDIYIKAFGNVSKQNLKALYETVTYLNTLKLPIKIYITNKENYNIDIYYGSKQYIKKMTHNKLIEKFGNATGTAFPNSKNFIERATIGIDSTSTYTFEFYKTNVILEELTQMLGVYGDSFSKVNSVFYGGKKNYNYSKKLANIDIKVLHLLYSDNIDVGLGINEFFNAFEEIIPHTNLKLIDYEEFDHFIAHTKFSQKALELFCRTAFADANTIVNEPHIQKWNGTISFMLYKDIDKQDSVLVSNTIKYLSEYTKIPEISFRTDENTNANLVFCYNKKINQIDQAKAVDEDILHYQIFNGTIFIINKANKTLNIIDREKFILRQLLIVLGLSPVNLGKEKPGTCILGKIDDSDTLLSQYDKELIELFFSETLKSGMTKNKVLEIIKKYYPIDSFLKENPTVIANQSQDKKDENKK